MYLLDGRGGKTGTRGRREGRTKSCEASFGCCIKSLDRRPHNVGDSFNSCSFAFSNPDHISSAEAINLPNIFSQTSISSSRASISQGEWWKVALPLARLAQLPATSRSRMLFVEWNDWPRPPERLNRCISARRRAGKCSVVRPLPA